MLTSQETNVQVCSRIGSNSGDAAPGCGGEGVEAIEGMTLRSFEVFCRWGLDAQACHRSRQIEQALSSRTKELWGKRRSKREREALYSFRKKVNDHPGKRMQGTEVDNCLAEEVIHFSCQ